MLNNGIKLAADRRSNSTKPYELEDYVNLRTHRKTIEGVFSTINSLISKKIHAVIDRGFELKIIIFVITAATIFLFQLVIRNLG